MVILAFLSAANVSKLSTKSQPRTIDMSRIYELNYPTLDCKSIVVMARLADAREKE